MLQLREAPGQEPLPQPLPYEERGDLPGKRARLCAHFAADVTPLLVGEGSGEGFLAYNSPAVSSRAHAG